MSLGVIEQLERGAEGQKREAAQQRQALEAQLEEAQARTPGRSHTHSPYRAERAVCLSVTWR